MKSCIQGASSILCLLLYFQDTDEFLSSLTSFSDFDFSLLIFFPCCSCCAVFSSNFSLKRFRIFHGFQNRKVNSTWDSFYWCDFSCFFEFTSFFVHISFPCSVFLHFSAQSHCSKVSCVFFDAEQQTINEETKKWWSEKKIGWKLCGKCDVMHVVSGSSDESSLLYDTEISEILNVAHFYLFSDIFSHSWMSHEIHTISMLFCLPASIPASCRRTSQSRRVNIVRPTDVSQLRIETYEKKVIRMSESFFYAQKKYAFIHRHFKLFGCKNVWRKTEERNISFSYANSWTRRMHLM